MCSKSRQIRNQVAPLILFSFQFMSILVRKQVVQLLLLLHSREQVRIESMTSKLLRFHVGRHIRKFKHYTSLQLIMIDFTEFCFKDHFFKEAYIEAKKRSNVLISKSRQGLIRVSQWLKCLCCILHWYFEIPQLA